MPGTKQALVNGPAAVFSFLPEMLCGWYHGGMLIVSNWKAYVTSAAKAKALFAAGKRAALRENLQIVLAPSAPYFGLLSSGNRSGVRFAAQDISDTTGGAETGEATASMYADLGAAYVIVGHSERRARGESDALVADKVRHALAHGLTPILCVGETERDSEARYLSHIRAQLSAAFRPLSQKERLALVVAYEPIWAIGKTSVDAISPTDLGEMVLYIRKILADFLPGKASQRVRILYGGSVEPSGIRQLATAGIDGFLVGHASVDVPTYTALIKAIS